MGRVFVTSGPGFFGRVPIIRLLAAGRELRTTMGSTTRPAEGRAMVEAGDVQPSPGASFIAADHDRHAESRDAVAGSEFIDDRIRLRE
jgi:nucleoside-diphosphate-sugar epimerase